MEMHLVWAILQALQLYEGLASCCQGLGLTLIPPEFLAWYRALHQANSDKKEAKKAAVASMKEGINEDEVEITEATALRKQSGKRRKTVHGALPANNTIIIDVEKTGQQPTLEAYVPSAPRNQSALLESNEAYVDTAVAKMIYCCNLPLNFAEGELFTNVLSKARMVSKDYVPPKRNVLGGALLEDNYKHVRKKNEMKIMKQASTFGITMKGGGATIGKKPLFNVLASSLGNTPKVLAVHDCSNHL
ncbi:hypothetical protein ACHAXR_001738, partial [Thalassiosira sp. AJA248-18]